MLLKNIKSKLHLFTSIPITTFLVSSKSPEQQKHAVHAQTRCVLRQKENYHLINEFTKSVIAFFVLVGRLLILEESSVFLSSIDIKPLPVSSHV